jgi:ABC-type multidrug transport system permease subunit
MVRRIAWLFAFTGVLLFAAMTSILSSGESHVRIPAIAALVTFGVIVMSYLGGIEGGHALREDAGTERTRLLALCLSCIPSLAAWGILWLPSPQYQIGTAIVLFVAVWSSDLYLASRGLIPSWFVDLRTAVTAIACVILGVAYYLL